MDLLVSIVDSRPPRGRVALRDDTSTADVPFVGWLGLLRVLNEIVGRDAEHAVDDVGLRSNAHGAEGDRS